MSPKAAKRNRKRQNKQAAAAARQAAYVRTKRRRRSVRLVAVVIAAAALLAFLAFQSSGGNNTAKTTNTTVTNGALPAGCTKKVPPAVPNRPTFSSAPEMSIDTNKTYTATFETTCGTFVAQLDAKNAPVTTNSFVFLARKGFFDGLKFHRVVDNFVIQGGDPQGSGSGGPGYTLAEEPPKDNTYHTGDLAMAKTGEPHSTGSQFFVVTGNPAPLNSVHTYSLFGHVTKGLDVAKKIESMHPKRAGYDGAPSPAAYIFKVTITESAA